MAQRNQFVDGILSDQTSLIHLLDNNDAEGNSEAHVIKHSHYYGETDFSKLLVNVVLRHNHLNPISTKLTSFDNNE